ncbi:hypothetical protein B484DRAFT_448813 [Ochromonadaceae sp. CCMP2298]|nr:hypothetical protein B484DRAFT_448813 [Ochromonadaceae sp. CCMP2298]|mmetsp:Transcript_18806/g.42014  ORF Transcript_18806/g.42014 Transcript_18806/m.42014 type:complete len:449 (+) Transcript_18806:341-1687(+)|eukprot:CAMPEP_0173331524 /NCGR_PEP_ID=MMETSP1144-20121109/3843_1 /TAXON_ID=483371 /ORGANISM="non described non described, Strain CCMP2298" /LENGTH=448 /DNA_ID=CAMNT_0014276303 /DNA_START=233 /DNA_END=1579 /DNA_ORIENTATION=+
MQRPAGITRRALQRGEPPTHSCVICLEQVPSRPGLMCGRRGSHFVCAECFGGYVDSLCKDVGKFSDAEYRVSCPFPGCRAPPWTTLQVRSTLDGPAQDQYVELLLELLRSARGKPKGEINSGCLVETLNLKCPSCGTVLDPNPDGCCAMRCLGCASYFCWLCFSTCVSSAACHDHVRVCSLSPQRGELFIDSKRVSKEVHKFKRIVALRQELLRLIRKKTVWTSVLRATGLLLRSEDVSSVRSAAVKELRASAQARVAVASIVRLLKNVDVSERDVFDWDATGLLPDAAHWAGSALHREVIEMLLWARGRPLAMMIALVGALMCGGFNVAFAGLGGAMPISLCYALICGPQLVCFLLWTSTFLSLLWDVCYAPEYSDWALATGATRAVVVLWEDPCRAGSMLIAGAYSAAVNYCWLLGLYWTGSALVAVVFWTVHMLCVFVHWLCVGL